MAVGPPRYRTPPSAILFGVVVMALVLAYVVIAFVYADGWWTILAGLLGAVLVFLSFGFLYAVATWWTRNEPSAHG